MADKEPFDLESLVQVQRDRLPGLVSKIEEIVRTVNPIELLSQLTLLHQTHPVDAENDADDKARWQVKIEWLAWLIFAHKIAAPQRPTVIDGQLLDALGQLLDEYIMAVAFSLVGTPPDLDPQANELRARIQTEALFVRGLGYPDEIRRVAVEVYSPHDEWCVANLGLQIQEALEIGKIVGEAVSDKVSDLRRRSREVEKQVEQDPQVAIKHLEGFPPAIREALCQGGLKPVDAQFARSFSGLWFFVHAPGVISFTQDELSARCDGRVAADRVAAFLKLLSIPSHQVGGEPSAIALSPFASAPFVLHSDNRFYIFVPPRLVEAIFYAFHSRLFADKRYRTTYDDARAAWLESSAVAAIEQLLVTAECGSGLFYGPKKQRLELDGIVVYDNKVILIECKSKSPTLAALAGDVPAILSDLSKAIIEPFGQAKRARDYIRGAPSVEFEEESTGRKIVVRSADISEIVLVTQVGSGAWASIAANLPSLVPLGLFADGEYPWALSLADLRVVTASFDVPSQLFDYLHRRYAMQKDGRFVLHDEWDFLDVYLAGFLDPNHPTFGQAPDANSIALDGFDDELQNYYYAKSVGRETLPERPRRKIPKQVLELLLEVERGSEIGRSDVIAEVLGWPEPGLNALESRLASARGKAILDGQPHAVTVQAPDKSLGIAVAYACRDGVGARRALEHAIAVSGAQTGIERWIGFGCNLGSADPPIVLGNYPVRKPKRGDAVSDTPLF